jgi:hypothetical protein
VTPRQPRPTGAAVVLALFMLAEPLAWAPPWTWALAVAGAAVAVLAALRSWRAGPALAVAAAVVVCASGRAGPEALAAEGLLVLAYVLAVDAPPGLTDPARWLRRQAALLIGGLVAAAVVLTVFAVRPSASPWLTVTALAAAVAAYLIALPRARNKLPRGWA